MKKIQLFKTIALLIVIFNIFNFFLLSASYTGINVTESASLSDYAFYNFTNIDGRYHIIGSASDNRLIPAIVLLFVDIYLLIVLVFFTPIHADYLELPHRKIFAGAFIGILLHLLLTIFSVPSSSFDESYFTMIGRGMLLNSIYIIGYLIIIWMFYRIKKKEYLCNDSINTKKIKIVDVVVIGILIELVLSFFYGTLVNRLIIKGIDRDGMKYTSYFGQVYLSQFTMIFGQKNVYNLSGKVENYPYMIICLIILVAQIILAIFKPKGKVVIISILSFINVIIMTIGLIDLCDSFYTNYININSRNFFKLVGACYYYVIALNIAITVSYLISMRSYDFVIVGTHEMENIANIDRLEKEEKNEDNLDAVNEKLILKESD